MAFDKFVEEILEKKKTEDRDLLKCPKCEGTWFEQREFCQFSDSTVVVFGQKVPPKSSVFILLVCGRCDEKLEPRLLRQARDNLDKEYDRFYDSMNKTVKTDAL
jgi:hypothetical protein